MLIVILQPGPSLSDFPELTLESTATEFSCVAIGFAFDTDLDGNIQGIYRIQLIPTFSSQEGKRSEEWGDCC